MGVVPVEEESTQCGKAAQHQGKIQGLLEKNPGVSGNIKRRRNNQVLSDVNSTKSSPNVTRSCLL